MISVIPYERNIWKASDGILDLFYCYDTGFINATRLCQYIHKNKFKNSLEHWQRSPKALRLEYELQQQLGKENAIEFVLGKETYIHPAMAVHLATWLGYQYSYPILKMLQEIVIVKDREKRRPLTRRPTTTHTFIFIELGHGKSLHQFYAVECPTLESNDRITGVCRNHPNSHVIFKQDGVPTDTNVFNLIKQNWNTAGDICIKHNYCGSALEEVALLEMLRKMCNSDMDPETMRAAYDVVDSCCASTNYDTIV